MNKETPLKWKVEEKSSLIPFIKKRAPKTFSEKDIFWSITHNYCRINWKVERFTSTTLYPDDHLEILLKKAPSLHFEKQNILYEQKEFLAYNKPAGLSSEQLSAAFEKLFSLPPHTSLVHRLDRDTTGLLLLAKDADARKALEHLFYKRKIEKYYLALTQGMPRKKQGVITQKMIKKAQYAGGVVWGTTSSPKGVFAKTSWSCLEAHTPYTLLKCRPFTGRTHQIRVHLKAIHLPLLGDYDYGKKTGPWPYPLCLHAQTLRFSCFGTTFSLKAPPPSGFYAPLKKTNIS